MRATTPGPLELVVTSRPEQLSEVTAARRRYTGAAVGADLAAAVIAAAASLMLSEAIPDRLTVAALVGAGVAWLTAAGMLGLYSDRRLSAVVEAEKAIAVVALGTLLVSVATGAAGLGIAITWGAGIAVSGVGRWLRRVAMSRARAGGKMRRRTLIVGTDERAGALSYALRDEDDEHAPLGFVAADGPLVSPDGLAVVGTIEDLASLIRRLQVERVAVAAGALDTGMLGQVIDVARRAGVEATVRTDVPPLRASRVTVEPMAGSLAMTIHAAHLSSWQSILKRTLDVVLGTLLLTTFAPAMLVIALAVRVSSRGPVIFRQARTTKGGRTFEMLKFRTMVADAERRVEGDDPTRPFFKIAGDPRVTRVGRILRRASLDELPQLLNVVRGDMSLVGPRPLPVEQVRANPAVLGPRHEVRAGLTGWWQVNGRDESDLERSLKQDLYYIRNWSVLLDLYILWRTAAAMIDRRGQV